MFKFFLTLSSREFQIDYSGGIVPSIRTTFDRNFEFDVCISYVILGIVF